MHLRWLNKHYRKTNALIQYQSLVYCWISIDKAKPVLCIALAG